MKFVRVEKFNMNLSKKQIVLIALLSALAASTATYFLKPTETKEVVKYKEAKNLTTVVTKYVYPDGSSKEQTVVKDKSVVSLEQEKITKSGLGYRLTLMKGFESEMDYNLSLHTKPMLNLLGMEIGAAAGLQLLNTNLNPNVGLYVQF